jgi:hypothetical protein
MGDFCDFDLADRISRKRTTMNAKGSPKTTPAVGSTAHVTFSPPPRPVRMKRYARVLLLFLILLLVVDVG